MSKQIKHNYKARKRDGFRCQFCGKTQLEQFEEHDTRLNVHHKDRDRDNNSLDNLITVCTKCHKRIHVMGEKCPKVFGGTRTLEEINEDRHKRHEDMEIFCLE